ncbi:nucleotidyltransferase family protein [Pseudaeromonas sp. ZJS20]|uniref:nucleotidyltransferase family protein n=1 Tax=Pseudaeromonas aegiceratis TaxID=3153928 RepID=UPI00390CC830
MAAQPQDWDRNWQYLQDHRLWGLAELALNPGWGPALLGPHWPRLQQKARSQRLSLLRLGAMQQHLQRRFDAAGLTLSVLKGPGLSQRLYGDMTLRHSKDLDLLVPPAQLWQACELLQAEGFTLLDAPPLHEANRRLVQRHYWHLTLRHAQQSVMVELHWRIEPLHAQHRETQWQLPFARDRIAAGELLYLLTHGARHHWFRLKWLGDIQAISEAVPGIWQEAQELARRQGLLGVLEQTALLLNWLWPVQTHDRAELQQLVNSASPEARYLAGEAQAFLLAHDYPEMTNCLSLRYRYRLHAYQGCLQRRYGWPARLRHLVDRGCFSREDMEKWRLPTSLLWAYPLLRLPLLIVRWGRARHDLDSVRHG